MRSLVALDMPAGTAFLQSMISAWEAGDAVLPLDPRLPAPARKALLERLRPGSIVDRAGDTTRLHDGIPVDSGDALVVATSGSTGDPKGVVLTHEAVRASALATSTRLGVDTHQDQWLACLPLAHVGGLSVLTRSIHTGTPIVIHDRFDPVRVEAAARAGATLVSLVPTALHRIHSDLFRSILLGGTVPPEGLPPNVVTTYGMTETGSGVVYDGLPLDGVQVKIGDGTTGSSGEVLLRGPMLLRCYRDGTDPRIGGGWLPTGDSGRLGSDGRLEVDGRMAEMIVTGGEKVWPAAVEAVLMRHRSVRDVAVSGRYDPEWGQRVVATIVPLDHDPPPRLDELVDIVRAELAPWAAPKQLDIVASLPRTSSGKIRRQALGDLRG